MIIPYTKQIENTPKPRALSIKIQALNCKTVTFSNSNSPLAITVTSSRSTKNQYFTNVSHCTDSKSRENTQIYKHLAKHCKKHLKRRLNRETRTQERIIICE